MTLVLRPETEAKLVARAKTEQLDPSELAEQILLSGLSWAELPEDDEVAAIEEGLRACEEGRVRSFDEYVAEQRSKYGSRGR